MLCDVMQYQLWDAPDDAQDATRGRYLLGADCVLCVYDVTDQASFDNVRERWALDAARLESGACVHGRARAGGVTTT